MNKEENKIYNEIDMNCTPDDFDMEGFGGPIEMDARPMKVISAQAANTGIQINKNYNDSNEDFSGINEIDMECDVCEDDDDDSFQNIKTKDHYEDLHHKDAGKPKELDTSIYYGETVSDWGDDEDDPFSTIDGLPVKRSVVKLTKGINDDGYVMSDDVPYDDTEELDAKELIDEDMLGEKKTTTPGKVENDYWKKLQKQHKSTNVKGAYNTHMHFAGDPQAEIDAFNSGFSTNGAVAASAGDAGGGEGCCEDLEITAAGTSEDWTSLAKALLSIVGFSVLKNSDEYILHDDCETCSDVKCKNNEEIFDSLKPYIDDCFIYPLQITTGQKFNDCKGWCDWYKGENCEKFPKCADDIKYCDLIANHINDCKF